jgi:peroxiredoxin
MNQTIEQQTQDFQKTVGTHLPPAVAEIFAHEQAAWRASELPDGAAQPGDALQSVALLDVEGRAVALESLWVDGPLVLVFYRGGWCPYCNIALRTYQQDLLPELRALGVRLVAISPQRPDQSLSTQEQAELTFDVLSDVGSTAARTLGITFQPADQVLAAQRELGLDLTTVNTENSAELPMPAVLVVDTAGIIRFVDIHPDYTSRTEVPAILEAVRSIVPV